MATNATKNIPLERSFVPVDPNAFPAVLEFIGKEDSPNAGSPILPYFGFNFAPTSSGYKSWYGTNNLMQWPPLAIVGTPVAGITPAMDTATKILSLDAAAFDGDEGDIVKLTGFLPAEVNGIYRIAYKDASFIYIQFDVAVDVDEATLGTVTPYGASFNIDDIFIYRTETLENLIFALCDDGIYTRDGKDDYTVAWTHAVTTTPEAAGTYLRWTKAVIGNTLYLYRQGDANVYRVRVDEDYVPTAFAPNTLTMSAQLGIFRANSRLGFWDSDNSIAWSDSDDVSDFVPSLQTLAGASTYKEVIGKITDIKASGDGFVVYSTRSITYVQYTPQSQFLFNPQAVTNEIGVAFASEIAVASPDTVQYAHSTVGLLEITGGTYKVLIPPVFDFLREARDPIPLKIVNGRHLHVSLIDPGYINGKVRFSVSEVPGTAAVYSWDRAGIFIDGWYDAVVAYEADPTTGRDAVLELIEDFGTSTAAVAGINTLVNKQPHVYIWRNNPSHAGPGYPVGEDVPVYENSWEVPVEIYTDAGDDTTSISKFKTLAQDAFIDERASFTGYQYYINTIPLPFLGMLTHTRSVGALEDAADEWVEDANDFIINALALMDTTERLGATMERAVLSSPRGTSNGSIESAWISGATYRIDGDALSKYRIMIMLEVMTETLDNPYLYPTALNMPAASANDATIYSRKCERTKKYSNFAYLSDTPSGSRMRGDIMDPQCFIFRNAKHWEYTFGTTWRYVKMQFQTCLAVIAEHNVEADSPAAGVYHYTATSLAGGSYSVSLTGLHAANYTALKALIDAAIAAIIGYDETISFTLSIIQHPVGSPLDPADLTGLMNAYVTMDYYIRVGGNLHHAIFIIQATDADGVSNARNIVTLKTATTLDAPYGTTCAYRLETTLRSEEVESDPCKDYIAAKSRIKKFVTYDILGARSDSLTPAPAWDPSVLPVPCTTSDNIPKLFNVYGSPRVNGVPVTYDPYRRYVNITPAVAGDLGNTLYTYPSGVEPFSSDASSGNESVAFRGFKTLLQDASPGAPYAIYAGTLAFDTQLKKWGKGKFNHRAIFDYYPINAQVDSSIPYDAFIMDAGALLSNGSICLFNDAPDESIIAYGKLGYFRQGFTKGELVKLKFRSASSGAVTVEGSLNGKAIDTALTSSSLFSNAIQHTHPLNLSARWFNIIVQGIFDLTDLEFLGRSQGKR